MAAMKLQRCHFLIFPDFYSMLTSNLCPRPDCHGSRFDWFVSARSYRKPGLLLALLKEPVLLGKYNAILILRSGIA